MNIRESYLERTRETGHIPEFKHLKECRNAVVKSPEYVKWQKDKSDRAELGMSIYRVRDGITEIRKMTRTMLACSKVLNGSESGSLRRLRASMFPEFKSQKDKYRSFKRLTQVVPISESAIYQTPEYAEYAKARRAAGGLTDWEISQRLGYEDGIHNAPTELINIKRDRLRDRRALTQLKQAIKGE